MLSKRIGSQQNALSYAKSFILAAFNSLNCRIINFTCSKRQRVR
jgi:hypothetical protein